MNIDKKKQEVLEQMDRDGYVNVLDDDSDYSIAFKNNLDVLQSYALDEPVFEYKGKWYTTRMLNEKGFKGLKCILKLRTDDKKQKSKFHKECEERVLDKLGNPISYRILPYKSNNSDSHSRHIPEGYICIKIARSLAVWSVPIDIFFTDCANIYTRSTLLPRWETQRQSRYTNSQICDMIRYISI